MPSLFSILDLEWERVARGPAAAELADVCSLVAASSLGDLVAHVRSASDAEADVVLVALAGRSAGGSELAARVLLQLLLPGTRRLAARWWALGDADARAAAAIAAVYGRIRRCPIDRRPQKIAANVLLDANQDLARAARKATRHAERIVTLDPRNLPYPAPVLEVSAGEELSAVVADAVAAGIGRADDAELILATRVRGGCLPAVAMRRGAKLRTPQSRRKTAEAALVAPGCRRCVNAERRRRFLPAPPGRDAGSAGSLRPRELPFGRRMVADPRAGELPRLAATLPPPPPPRRRHHVPDALRGGPRSRFANR